MGTPPRDRDPDEPPDIFAANPDEARPQAPSPGVKGADRELPDAFASHSESKLSPSTKKETGPDEPPDIFAANLDEARPLVPSPGVKGEDQELPDAFAAYSESKIPPSTEEEIDLFSTGSAPGSDRGKQVDIFSSGTPAETKRAENEGNVGPDIFESNKTVPNVEPDTKDPDIFVNPQPQRGYWAKQIDVIGGKTAVILSRVRWSVPWALTQWMIAIPLGITLGLLKTPPAVDIETELSDAISSREVEVSFGAGNGYQSVTMTVSLLHGVATEANFSLPAGTPIYATNPNTQTLLTAGRVFVQLSTTKPVVQMSIPTYCADQFAEEPSPQSALALLPPEVPVAAAAQAKASGDFEWIETNAVRKLVAKLEGSGADSETRQTAIWMYGSGNIYRLYSEVRSDLLKKFNKRIGEGFDAGTKTEDILQYRPAGYSRIGPAQIRTAVQRARGKFVADEAKRQAEAMLRNFIDKGVPLLEENNIPVKQRTFFQSYVGSD